jgi:hypothetical protein
MLHTQRNPQVMNNILRQQQQSIAIDEQSNEHRKQMGYHLELIFEDHLSAFRDRGVPGPTSECRCVPQPRWVGARPSAKGEARSPEAGVREVKIPRPSCSSRAQVGCACSRGLQASTRVREQAALRERLSRPRPRAANPL